MQKSFEIQLTFFELLGAGDEVAFEVGLLALLRHVDGAAPVGAATDLDV